MKNEDVVTYYNKVNNGIEKHSKIITENSEITNLNEYYREFPIEHINILKILSKTLKKYTLHININNTFNEILYTIFLEDKDKIPLIKNQLRNINTELPLYYVILCDNRINYENLLNDEGEQFRHYLAYAEVINKVNTGALTPIKIKHKRRH